MHDPAVMPQRSPVSYAPPPGASLPVPSAPLPMAGCVVCSTGLAADDKALLVERVQLMGGEFARALTNDTTHLVARAAGAAGGPSRKYAVWTAMGKAVLGVGWAEAAWGRVAQGRTVNVARLAEVHRLPALAGCVVCVTGLTPDERVRISACVTRLGGAFVADLTRAVTHLVANEAQGRKVAFAVEWGIVVVHAAWLYDSVQLEACADEALYRFDGGVISGPVGTEFLNPGPEDPSGGDPWTRAVTPGPLGHATATVHSPATWSDAERRELLEISPRAQIPYLENCRFFLGDGFSKDGISLLRKVIRNGGGMRLYLYEREVTHFVCKGRVLSAFDRKIIRDSNHSSKIIHDAWLAACYRSQSLLDTVDYDISLEIRSAATLFSPTTTRILKIHTQVPDTSNQVLENESSTLQKEGDKAQIRQSRKSRSESSNHSSNGPFGTTTNSMPFGITNFFDNINQASETRDAHHASTKGKLTLPKFPSSTSHSMKPKLRKSLSTSSFPFADKKTSLSMHSSTYHGAKKLNLIQTSRVYHDPFVVNDTFAERPSETELNAVQSRSNDKCTLQPSIRLDRPQFVEPPL